MKRFTIAGIFIIALLILLSCSKDSIDVLISWDPNDGTPEGYRVYVRKEGETYNYASPNWTGSETSCVISVKKGETNYFVVRAFYGETESNDSDEKRFNSQY